MKLGKSGWNVLENPSFILHRYHIQGWHGWMMAGTRKMGGMGRKMILNTLYCGNAWAILTLDVAPKKGTTFTRRQLERDEGYPVGPELWFEYRKRVGQKDYVVVESDTWQKCWPDRRRRVKRGCFANRVKTSQSGVHSRPSLSRSTERHSRIKTDYIPMSNGTETHTSRSLAVICVAALSPPFVRSSLLGTFPQGPRCVLVTNWRRELAAVNNTMMINRGEIP